MRILFFIDSLGSGGAQKQIAQLASALKKEGHHAKVLIYREDDFFEYILNESRVEVVRIIEKNPILRLFKLIHYIRGEDKDVVISFLDTPNFISSIAAIGKKNWKLVINERNSNISSFNSLKGRIFKFFSRYSDYIICNSYTAQKLWEKKYPQYKSKLKTIYNIVTLPKLSRNKIASYNNQHFPIKKIIIAARFEEHKNLNNVIEALNLLEPHERDYINLEWYGRIEGTLNNKEVYNQGKKKIEAYKLEKTIKLFDATHNISSKIASSDVVGLFSFYEGMPNSIIEGMYNSKPIIMTRVSDYEILTENNNGFLCEPSNPDSIKEAFLEIINANKDDLKEKGENSKKLIEVYFDKNKILNEWKNVLNN